MSMANPIHPGVIVREDFLNELGISVTETALALGIARVTLSRVLNGRAAVTPAMAVRFESAGIGTAELWLDLQKAYDLAAERAKPQPNVRRLIAA